MSGDQIWPGYLSLHVATLRINEKEKCSSYRNKVGASNEREKSLMSGGQPSWSMGQFSVMKLISTPISNHSYHLHFVSLINPILRLKHLNP